MALILAFEAKNCGCPKLHFFYGLEPTVTADDISQSLIIQRYITYLLYLSKDLLKPQQLLSLLANGFIFDLMIYNTSIRACIVYIISLWYLSNLLAC